MEVAESVQTEKEVADETKEVKTKPETKTSSITKIDSFVKFKTPDKSQKRAKTESVQQKTPVKYDCLVETAMPSWSDNSSNDIIKPKESEPMETDKDEVMVIEDSEDIKLVYEETQTGTQSPKENKNEKLPKTNDNQSTQSSDANKHEKTESNETKSKPTSQGIENTENKSESKDTSKSNESPKGSTSPKQCVTPTSKQNESSFLKQAKVTDMKEPALKAAPSPKAPRRVSFVTLSSPKNSKKKC